MKSEAQLIASGTMSKEIDTTNKRSPFFHIYNKYESEEDLIDLAHELVRWVQNPTSLVLAGFCAQTMIPHRVFYRWLNRSKELREAWEYSKEVIGVRRELGCLNGELNGLMVWRTMAMYDPQYKKLEIWRAKLRASVEEGKSYPKIEITMPKWYLPKPEIEKDEKGDK